MNQPKSMLSTGFDPRKKMEGQGLIHSNQCAMSSPESILNFSLLEPTMGGLLGLVPSWRAAVSLSLAVRDGDVVSTAMLDDV